MPPFWRGRRVRRDYSRKSFTNPLFNPGRGRGDGRWRRRLTIAAILAALIGWIWFVVFSPAFRVTDIEVRGNTDLPTWEIRDTVNEVLNQRRWLIVPQKSLLIVPEEALTSALNDHYVLESLTVTKVPPHKLIIELTERTSAILLQMTDGSQGLIDLQGSVTRLYKPEEALDVVKRLGPNLNAESGQPARAMPVVFDDRAESLNLREEALHPAIVQAAIDLPKFFMSRFGQAPYIDELHIDGRDAQTIRAVTSEGWAIYLDASQDLQEQLANAETILKTKVGGDRRNLDYIDVRFGDKIFFKLKS